MSVSQTASVPVFAAGVAVLVLPRILLRSAGGDDLFPGDQAPLNRLVRFLGIVLIVLAVLLFFQLL